MRESKIKSDEISVGKTVISNTVPAMLGSIMVLIYNMADLYFIGQTGDHLQVAAVSLSTPLFLIFMSWAMSLVSGVLPCCPEIWVEEILLPCKKFLHSVFGLAL